jgi:hypothetical protein
MSNKSTLAVCIAALAAIFFAFLKETYLTVLVDFTFDYTASFFGVERARMIAASAPFVISAMAGSVVVSVAYLLGVRDRNAKSPLEITFDPKNPEHVRTRQGWYPETSPSSSSQYYIEVRNRTRDRTVYNVEVEWDEVPFTTFIDAELRRDVLIKPFDLDPQERMYVHLFGVDDKICDAPNSTDLLKHASHFIARARGRDAAEITAKFEYNPFRFPKLSWKRSKS